MISNPKLKKIFQTYVFGVVSIINKRIRHDKRKIILYSNMGFRDNVKSLYDYLIEQKYNEQYEIIYTSIICTTPYTSLLILIKRKNRRMAQSSRCNLFFIFWSATNLHSCLSAWNRYFREEIKNRISKD